MILATREIIRTQGCVERVIRIIMLTNASQAIEAEVERWTAFLGIQVASECYYHQSTASDCHHYKSCYHLQSKNYDLKEYIDRQSGSYSGGNKRKLNVAMSLVDKNHCTDIIVLIAASSKRSSGWRTTSCLPRRAKYRSGSCGKKEPVVHYRLAWITFSWF